MDLRDQNFTFVGIGSVIKGDIVLKGPSHICSTIEGDIQIDESFTLTIEPQGIVEGRIRCGDLNIYGEVSGDITAQGKVKVFPTGVVKGQIVAKNINIAPGATVNMQGHTLESQS
ncbi:MULTISPECIES: bactofilin family protein [Halobacteriovorax]|uniref:Polymer-forming cytoskeletal protein n=1 Tax=Halobacteriovorax vibrionivorans TaxID=2152716 RepID=A0ABY0IF69_9BACT|nr:MULTISPECIES: polymer-forming cytoskeletal protein [Halobacteriovorax]AYF44232.1 polymer-forming cytoskeletal family protein [Halobacteriovorax sp. BALOs_7]RZF21240.1 polymer-forming cytoskeletal protein [Halobacteriovorax vibrionivorans]TGD48002.1 polymer-forming cytoskeletal protein [Halobacteriovorax sp. Y22]